MHTFNLVGDGTVNIGQSTSIGLGAQIVFSRPGTVTIGDYCTIGAGVKIVCFGGDVTVGDWTTLHDNCLVLSGDYVRIGQHGWFGQNCVIDGSGGLSIGNGVRVGMYSQIWSHVAAGEQLEGCTLFGERPVAIEDDVWLVGSCIVASGVTLGRRTVALIGSNITKSWPANSVLAGTPAAAKPSLTFYKEVTLEDKWQLMRGWLKAASEDLALITEERDADLLVVTSANGDGRVIFGRTSTASENARRADPDATVCCIEAKTYDKRYSGLEKRLLKYLSGNKARFLSR